MEFEPSYGGKVCVILHYIVCAYLGISSRWEQMTPLGTHVKGLLIVFQHYQLGTISWFYYHMVP